MGRGWGQESGALLTPCMGLNFEDGRCIIGSEVMTVSGERPCLQTHWKIDIHTLRHIHISLCQTYLTLRQRKHAGRGEWRLRALITADLGAGVKLVERTTVCFSCDKESESVAEAAKPGYEKKMRGGKSLSTGLREDSLEK